jgi:cation transport regulator ChaB
MSKKEKSIKEIEKQILDELGEEIRELRKQGKLYLFEKAMGHAMEKFKKAVKRRSEEEIEEYNNEGTLKKTVKNADEKQE